MMRPAKLIPVVTFLAVVLILVPWAIEVSGRADLYYTLTSVALLSIA